MFSSSPPAGFHKCILLLYMVFINLFIYLTPLIPLSFDEGSAGIMLSYGRLDRPV